MAFYHKFVDIFFTPGAEVSASIGRANIIQWPSFITSPFRFNVSFYFFYEDKVLQSAAYGIRPINLNHELTLHLFYRRKHAHKHMAITNSSMVHLQPHRTFATKIFACLFIS